MCTRAPCVLFGPRIPQTMPWLQNFVLAVRHHLVRYLIPLLSSRLYIQYHPQSSPILSHLYLSTPCYCPFVTMDDIHSICCIVPTANCANKTNMRCRCPSTFLPFPLIHNNNSGYISITKRPCCCCRPIHTKMENGNVVALADIYRLPLPSVFSISTSRYIYGLYGWMDIYICGMVWYGMVWYVVPSIRYRYILAAVYMATTYTEHFDQTTTPHTFIAT